MVYTQDIENRPESPSPAWSPDWKMAVVGAYYILCLVLTTTVSSWVTEWIAQHGWEPFNRYLRILAVVCGVIAVGLILRKLCRREGSLGAWLLIAGTGAALYLFAQHLVILGSEYVHYPEYAALFILLFWATRGQILWALGLSIAAGTFDEAIQAFIPKRVVDINDILLNIAGSLIGLILVWLVWPMRTEKHES